MRQLFRLALAALLLSAGLASSAAAESRIKDIVAFEGVRDNMLVGYGLVVGLNNTGDSLQNAPFTKQAIQSMMERLGVNTHDPTASGLINTKNVAAVMVTARLPPFAAPGSQIDATVSAMGDAKSLLGGTLLMTSLVGADGQIYAAAQGTVQTGAVSASGASGSSITRGVPTAGRIAAGAIVEKEVGFDLASMSQLRMTLRNPDFTTAHRIADAINAKYPGVAVAENPTIVALRAPAGRDMVSLVTAIEDLDVEPEAPAKVVIDEVAGVVVMGSDVRISQVAIAQGNLTINVQEAPQVSQPLPFSQGQTTTVPQSKLSVDEEKGKKLLVVGGGASLSSLVTGLNALGVTPRDMISILQTIKAAGALQADYGDVMTTLGLLATAVDPTTGATAATSAAELAKRGQIHQTAQKFEASFLSTMFQTLFSSVPTDQTFGGGAGEDMWKGFLAEAMAKETAKRGGIGVSQSVEREMLKLQGLTDASPTTGRAQ